MLRLRIEQLEQLLHRTIDRSATNKIKVAQGIGASPGAASGKIIFDIDEAIKNWRERYQSYFGKRRNKTRRCACIFCICWNIN